MRTCGVILAGGKSSRMGKNKALLPILGKPVIQHVAKTLSQCTEEVFIIANKPSDYAFLNVPIFSDRYVHIGPLGGMESAFYHIKADRYVFAACDMPFVNPDVYNLLLGKLGLYEAVIPVYDQHMHPLCGIYHKSIFFQIVEQINKHDYKLKHLLDQIHVNYISTFDGVPNKTLEKHFFNMNDPNEYEKAKLL